MVKVISESEFKDSVKDDISVIDFSAIWCMPCKMLAPVIEEVSEELSDVKFFNVDVDNAPALSRELGIMAVPSIFLFKNGEQKSFTTGFMQKEVLKGWIKENL